MRNGFFLAGLLLLVPAVSRARAQAGPAPRPELASELASSLRNILLVSLPDPLYEDTSHWGGQRLVSRRLVLRGRGDGESGGDKKMRNDGLWWKVRVTADRPKETLSVRVRDLRQPEPGKMLFTTDLALDANVDYDRQRWRSGLRLLAAGMRARMRIKVTLECEVAASFQAGLALLPEVVFRLRVLRSEAGCDNIKVEHIAGFGGDGAKLVGNTLVENMRQWRPSLERRLLEKANAAIVKAGDTKEVRVSLFGLLRK